MNNILCRMNLFTTQQQIYLLFETGGIQETIECPLIKLGETLAQLALNKNSQTVNIMGNSQYAQKIIKDFKEALTLTNSKQNIILKVNGIEVCN